MMKQLRWGILGTGNIARKFTSALPRSNSARAIAVGSRSETAARAFAEEFGVTRFHGGYDALLADNQVDAVYISTPHPQHARWAIAAAEAGKHILCEKPLALNHAEAAVVVEAAAANGVFLMEAFMYRCHPQTEKLLELIRSGIIGEVRVIEAEFSFNAPVDPASRLFNHDLGGGAILDVGGYPMSMARLLAGAAMGKPFAEPDQFGAAGTIGAISRVDEWSVASLRFPGGIVAQLRTGLQLPQSTRVAVIGSAGRLEVPSPWVVSRDGGESRLLLHRPSEDTETLIIREPRPLYAVEADAFAGCVAGERPSPMSIEDTLGNMRALDRWRSAIGMIYDAEQPQSRTRPAHAQPLCFRGVAPAIPSARLHGLEKPVSRLILGTERHADARFAEAMMDTFFEYGGQTFDTAYVYGGGRGERTLGGWIQQRGVREAVTILAKGAHTPDCFPDQIRPQLEVTLDRLQTDHVELYALHRDNPDVPADEFIEALAELHAEGRIRLFGGSNWSPARIDAANRYARGKGLPGFSFVNNQFSLARMVDPVWAGCVSAGDHESRCWLAATGSALFAWSSQARGFFTDQAHPEKRADEDLVRCWYADDNFERQRRARRLAEEKGVSAINIALAYVLSQPFPAFALIGPLHLSEIRTSLPGIGIALNPQELAWLSLETDERPPS
ncbi:MAG: aldo/keto reductase [Opitutales bacterium]|nr:aldo/keto reductase [Opitutales bacterium]